ncbi:MAG TPA: LysR substrate-binding domain-containing protein [Ramlibacter sp.]|nr:LysR substrate-binding domain-containing protein [Ramlibacter sp.]
MELRQIRYFVVTAEEGNISRAAERLHLSQPSLSQQLRELEAEFGFELLERVPRGVRLLPAGESFLAGARRVLAELEEAQRRTRAAHRGEAGRLRVGFNIGSGRQRLVGEALQRFRESWPSVSLDLVEINSSEQPAAFRAGAIDVGFLYRQGEPEEFLDYRTLREDRCVLAVSRFHPLAQSASVAPEALRDEPFVWLARSVNAPLHDSLLAFLHGHGIVPRVVQDAGSSASQLNLVSVGMGVGIVAQVPGVEAAGDVRFLPIQGLGLRLPFCLAHRRDDHSPLVTNFGRAVDEVLNNP